MDALDMTEIKKQFCKQCNNGQRVNELESDVETLRSSLRTVILVAKGETEYSFDELDFSSIEKLLEGKE